MLLRIALFHFFFFLWQISGFWMYLGSKFQIFHMAVILYPLDPAFPLVLSVAALPVTCVCSSFTDFFGVVVEGVSPVSGPLHMLRFFPSLCPSFTWITQTLLLGIIVNASSWYLTLQQNQSSLFTCLCTFCSLFSLYDTGHSCKRCWFVCLLVQYSSPTLDWELHEDSGCICGDCNCFWHIVA